MTRDERRAYFDDILRNVDEKERALVDGLLDEIVYYEEQMQQLREQPFIIYHPKLPGVTKVSPSARLYKDFRNSYMNAIRIILNVLRKVESDAQDDLLKKLEEFKL